MAGYGNSGSAYRSIRVRKGLGKKQGIKISALEEIA